MEPRPQKQQIIDSQFLLTAYCNGYFPMADTDTGEIGWYAPDPRTIFDLTMTNLRNLILETPA